MIRLGVLASGRGSNAGAIFTAIDARRLDAEAVLLICDRPAGAEGVAADHGVAARRIERADYPTRAAQNAAILAALLEARVDLVALAGWAAILDANVVDAFEERIVNIHPSLLPAFAGSIAPEPQAAALRAGVNVSGCTVHIVTAEVDGGPIVAQATVPVRPDDDVETLAARILVEEHRLYPQVLQWFAEGRVRLEAGTATVREA